MKDRLKKVKKPKPLLQSKKKELNKMKKKKVKLQDMSLDDFFNGVVNDPNFCDSDDESDDGSKETEIKSTKKKKKVVKKEKQSKSKKLRQQNESEDTVNDDDNDSENEGEENEEKDEDMSDNESNLDDEVTTHKKQLEGLKSTDPEFYKFLEENDQGLLNFSDPDIESDEDEEKVHKPPDELEVASDESDYEPDEEIKKTRKGASNKVTQEMITEWQKQLQSKCDIGVIRDVIEAFHAALVSVSPDDDATSKYKVEGSSAFNSVVRMCVIDLLPGIQTYLGIKQGSKSIPIKSKNWVKLRVSLKNYLSDLTELSGVSSPSMLRVLLKHLHQMSPYIVFFPGISPKILKRMIQLWAMDEEVVRVLAFLVALRLTNLRSSLLRQGLKMMYITYVKNTRFVSPNSLPGINFMRQSLCEMFALDDTTSYQMTFVYIRQLAVHLRNAITLKKKDAFKTVYNWAYVSSLQLWGELFGIVPERSPLRTLIYPLVQIIIGTINLIPSAQYYPLRFHCCRILINLSNKAGVFIPVLPFLLEVLRDFNFNREHKKLSMKPMDLTCLLRCSKSQMKENGFKDALVENIHNLLMEYLAMECHKVSFPDMTVTCVLQLKQFLKTCTVVNYTKKLKAILDKISENSKFIEGERKKVTMKLDDVKGVEAVEAGIRAKEPPFLKYYENWKKIHVQQQAKKVTNNEKLGDFKLPVLYKLNKKRSRIETKSVGPPELFPSDDDDSVSGDIFKDEDETEEEPPKKRKKEKAQKEPKKAKKPTAKVNKETEDDLDDLDQEDIVEDLHYSDFK